MDEDLNGVATVVDQEDDRGRTKAHHGAARMQACTAAAAAAAVQSATTSNLPSKMVVTAPGAEDVPMCQC
jgi:hypothetical protein